MPLVRRFFPLQLIALVAAAITMNGQTPAAAPAPAGKLGSAEFRFEDLQAKTTGNGTFRRVTDAPTATFEKLECHVTTLLPGKMSHPPHHHPQEEFIILQEGTLDVYINGRTQRVGPGSMFFFASQDWHNVTNVGPIPAKYFVFNFTTGATHHVSEKPAAESAPAQALKSSVFDWSKLAVKPTKTGERRSVVDSPTVTCANFELHITTLRPGEVPHSPHHHPDEEILLVKDGTVEATINGAAKPGGPGTIFFFASNDQHGLKNIGATEATYYVMRIVTPATPKVAMN